ncbi:M20 family metallopeptidase [Brachybacterium alimentarium]|uniref:M20 family metallopeptidase n=1 Tax=Brachybacterium alimentarium TaxID=47845 RepID=UPI003FD335E5
MTPAPALSVQDVNRLVEGRADELIALTAKLVRTPSENRAPDGDEKECQAVLGHYLHHDRIELDLFTPAEVVGVDAHEAWWPGRSYDQRPNLVATLRGSGDGRSVILNGHVDTVTREPLPWGPHGPFSGKVIDGKLFGRGSYDMKAGLAALAVVVRILADEGIALPGDVIFESVVDEENAGANGTLACCVRGYEADLVIIPEPTNMEVCPQARGGQVFTLTAEGHGGVNYSGEAFGNPASELARLLVRLQEFEQKIGYPQDGLSPRSVVLAKMASGDLSAGGNIGIPARAWAEFFVQTSPGTEEAELAQEVADALFRLDVPDDIRTELTASSRYLYPADTPVDHEGVKVLLDAYAEVSGTTPTPGEATFAGDGALFNRYFDTPSVHFGPRGGNAHGPNEHVDVDSIVDLTKTLLLAVTRWCG